MVPWKDLALRIQYGQMKEHKFGYRSVIWPLVAQSRASFVTLFSVSTSTSSHMNSSESASTCKREWINKENQLIMSKSHMCSMSFDKSCYSLLQGRSQYDVLLMYFQKRIQTRLQCLTVWLHWNQLSPKSKRLVHDLRVSFPAAVTPLCSSISISRMSLSVALISGSISTSSASTSSGDMFSYARAGPGSTPNRANDAVSWWACRSSRKETRQNATNCQESTTHICPWASEDLRWTVWRRQDAFAHLPLGEREFHHGRVLVLYPSPYGPSRPAVHLIAVLQASRVSASETGRGL